DTACLPPGAAVVLIASGSSGALRVLPGASLDLRASSLTVHGKVEAGGTITGSGSVVLDGPGSVNGRLPNLTLAADATLNDLTVSGKLAITRGSVTAAGAVAAGSLAVSGGTLTLDGSLAVSGDALVSAQSLASPAALVVRNGGLTVGGSLSTTGYARLLMSGAAGSAEIVGPLRALSLQESRLTAGVLTLRGGLSVQGTGKVLTAEPPHRTVLAGPYQSVSFERSNSAYNHLASLESRASAATLDSDLYLSGDLTVASGLLAVASNRTVRAAGNLTVQAGSTLENAGSLYYGGQFTLAGILKGNQPRTPLP
ncbi:MAG TPA: polymer-forming cytoskeletal protein, partial [Deinococcales bacterium]|nr:polymer-forming cytoskeletal protein [Deinococcales bacterium]